MDIFHHHRFVYLLQTFKISPFAHESFNALSVAACLSQGLQAINRIVSATLLLADQMTHEV